MTPVPSGTLMLTGPHIRPAAGSALSGPGTFH
jgi:hypothetical protein